MKITSIVRVAALIAAAAVATPAFAGDTVVKGKVFFDYSKATVTKANGTKTSTSGGNVTRTYLTVKRKLDDVWSVRVTMDSALNTKATGKKNEVFLKYANLTGKFMPEANIKLGLIETAWIGHEDKLGKHRYISKSFVDKQKLDSSADVGVGVFGKLADGLVNYDIDLINGGGYGNTARTKSQDVNARVGFAPIEGLTIDFGYRNGYAGSNSTGNIGTREILTQTMITYGTDDFRVGANYILHDSKKDGVTITTKAQGLDLWAWANISDSLGAFANYESWKKDKNAINPIAEKRMIVSLDYKANKKALLSLVYTHINDLKNVTGDKETIIGLYSQFKF